MTETCTFAAAELRFADDTPGVFTGYAAVFDAPNALHEIVKRGAFSRTLAEHRANATKPGMFWSHDPSQPIGVWTSLVEDQRGLLATGKLVTETRAGAEALALLKAGAITGLSIGFRARHQERGTNGAHRVLTDIDLVEISLVSLPAASQARVTHVRSSASTDTFVAAVRRAAHALKGGSPHA